MQPFGVGNSSRGSGGHSMVDVAAAMNVAVWARSQSPGGTRQPRSQRAPLTWPHHDASGPGRQFRLPRRKRALAGGGVPLLAHSDAACRPPPSQQSAPLLASCQWAAAVQLEVGPGGSPSTGCTDSERALITAAGTGLGLQRKADRTGHVVTTSIGLRRCPLQRTAGANLANRPSHSVAASLRGARVA
jgi:hypothetical protein